MTVADLEAAGLRSKMGHRDTRHRKGLWLFACFGNLHTVVAQVRCRNKDKMEFQRVGYVTETVTE